MYILGQVHSRYSLSDTLGIISGCSSMLCIRTGVLVLLMPTRCISEPSPSFLGMCLKLRMAICTLFLSREQLCIFLSKFALLAYQCHLIVHIITSLLRSVLISKVFTGAFEFLRCIAGVIIGFNDILDSTSL